LDALIEDCQNRLKKIIDKVNAQQIRFGGQLLGTMSLSIGVVEASESLMDADELLNAADKNHVCCQVCRKGLHHFVSRLGKYGFLKRLN